MLNLAILIFSLQKFESPDFQNTVEEQQWQHFEKSMFKYLFVPKNKIKNKDLSVPTMLCGGWFGFVLGIFFATNL